MAGEIGIPQNKTISGGTAPDTYGNKDWWATNIQPTISHPNYTSTPGPTRNLNLPIAFGMANNTFLNAKPTGVGAFGSKSKSKKPKKQQTVKFRGI